MSLPSSQPSKPTRTRPSPQTAALEADENEAVAADRSLTGAGAVVGIVEVGVVALFNASEDESVSADREPASARARIGIIKIAIVAILVGLDDPVSAVVRVTSGWVGAIIAVAIVTVAIIVATVRDAIVAIDTTVVHATGAATARGKA